MNDEAKKFCTLHKNKDYIGIQFQTPHPFRESLLYEVSRKGSEPCKEIRIVCGVDIPSRIAVGVVVRSPRKELCGGGAFEKSAEPQGSGRCKVSPAPV